MVLFVHDAYDEIAKKFPKTDAVFHAKTLVSLTYSDLASTSREFSQKLRQLGAGEMTVCVISGRDLNLLPLYVGVSRLAHCSLLPLPNWGEASLSGISLEKWRSSTEFAIQASGASIVIVDDEEETFSTLSKILTWSEFTNIVPSSSSPEVSATSDSVILKLLSGGSTGAPKLHAVSHRMVLSELKGYPEIVAWARRPDSRRILQQSSLAWPASAFGQINIALAFGGTLVVSSSTRSVEELANIVDEHKVTMIGGAPSQLNLLFDFLSIHIPVVFTWGEPLARALGERLASRTSLLIELLVATEYWLCLYCVDLSGCMQAVADCSVSIIDADANGVGQLSLAGPMVQAGGPLVTSDLVKRKISGSYQFVGRSDFLTKIAGNWFDVRDLESALFELDFVEEALVVSALGVHYVVLVFGSTSPDMSKVKETVSIFSPVELQIRVFGSLPTVSATGKIDRRQIISRLPDGTRPEHVGLEASRSRFFSELKSHSKWTFFFAILLGPKSAIAAPYIYLFTLYLPSSGYLPRCKVRSVVASLGSTLNSLLREIPFGRAGLICAISYLAQKSKKTAFFLRLITAIGVWLAWRGDRLFAWWVTFWLGAGKEIRDESGYWLGSRKWYYLVDNVKFLILSLPDTFAGTCYCQQWDETMHKELPASKAEENKEDINRDVDEKSDEEEFVIPKPEMSPENTWWYNSPVEYISVPASTSIPRRAPPVLLDPEGDSLETFVCSSLQTVSPGGSLLGLSSLQVTSLVQLLRKRVPLVSARSIMTALDLPSLIQIMTTSLGEEKTVQQYVPPCRVKIQFSAGQINRVCRWMIRARKPVDRARLSAAVAALVARHPLLRASIVEPKALHSFVHDTGVLLVNYNRLFGQGKFWWTAVHHVLSRCIYGSWSHVTVFSPSELPAYWVDTVTTSKVSDLDHMRRTIQTMRRDVEDSWFTHQNPLNVHVFATAAGDEYILISIKHSFSDGNSAIPILDDLAMLYDDKGDGTLACPLAMLEKRCYDGITSNLTNPDRTALRSGIFYAPEIDALGGGYYRHYICLEPGAVAMLRRCASQQLGLSFDSVLLGLIALALMRTDEKRRETFTLYCPLRDGPGESGVVGLLTDWRDITFVAAEGATVWDALAWGVADRIKRRDWDPTLPPGGPESVLINWLAFDGTPRLEDKSWEPFHLDKVTMRWNKMERDFEPHSTPSGRARSMSLEQYDVEGQWWLRFDVAARMYPAGWMMRFGQEMNRTFNDITGSPMNCLV